MKHVLFLSYDGMTDPLGQSQVIPYLKGLSAFGYTFTLLSCDKPALYHERRAQVEAMLDGYPIKWVSIPYHKNPPVLSSVYDAYRMYKTACKLHRYQPFHMVHTRPGVPPLVALRLKKRFGIKFLNDVRGFWADERVDGGMWNLSNPLFKKIYRFFKKQEDLCLEKADYNVCLTYAAEKIIHARTEIPNQPVPLEVIPCSADLELFDPERIGEAVKYGWKKKLAIPDDRMVISYLGSIGGWYLTAEMMQMAGMILKHVPNAHFLFISPHRHEEIYAAAKAAGISEEKLSITAASRKEVPELLSLSDYSLFFIKPCFSKLSSSPTKHGEIMAMGIPVITNSGVGDVADIVQRYNGGFVLDDFSIAEMENIGRSIASGKKFDAAGIRKGAEDYYSLHNAVQRYRKVYDAVLKIGN